MSSSTMPLSSKIPATRVMWPRPSAGAVSWRAPTSTCTSRTWGRSSASAVGRSPACGDGHDERGRTGLVLQLQRRALGDDRAAVDHDDVVGELVGLLEVLRRQQQGGPVGDELAQHLPQLHPRARVEARGRLVEEQHRRRRDQAHREVEPSPHAAGVGLGGAVAGVGEREALEQLVARAPDVGRVEAVELADQAEVLPTGQQLVDGRGLPGQPHAAAHGRRARSRMSWPATRAVPAVGRVRVVIIRTVVVLPAPLGPSSPSTEPSGTAKDDAVHGHGVAEVLDQAARPRSRIALMADHASRGDRQPLPH